jgi:hypothetical protein
LRSPTPQTPCANSAKKVAQGSIILTRDPAIACVATRPLCHFLSRRGVSGAPRVSNNKIRKTTGQTNPPASRNRSLDLGLTTDFKSVLPSRLIYFGFAHRIFKICCRSHSRHDSNAARDVQPRPPQLLQEAYPRAGRCTKQLGQKPQYGSAATSLLRAARAAAHAKPAFPLLFVRISSGRYTSPAGPWAIRSRTVANRSNSSCAS